MIIQGGSRSNAGQLGRYLLNEAANDRVAVLECPASARDVPEALEDMERMGRMTRGSKTLYHAQINPAPGYDMRRADWDRSVEVLASKLGLENQPRAVVLHEKEGREHAHVVFQRADIGRGRLISDSHNYARHREAGEQLEQELGHEKVNRKTRGQSFTKKKRARPRRSEPIRNRSGNGSRISMSALRRPRNSRKDWRDALCWRNQRSEPIHCSTATGRITI